MKNYSQTQCAFTVYKYEDLDNGEQFFYCESKEGGMEEILKIYIQNQDQHVLMANWQMSRVRQMPSGNFLGLYTNHRD